MSTTVLDRTPATWVAVCPLSSLTPERGVAALVHGEQVAVFLLHDGSLRAVGNIDPVSGVGVISRGIVGTRGGRPTVASPMYKQVYDLDSGRCLDTPELTLPVYPVRLREGAVEVGVP